MHSSLLFFLIPSIPLRLVFLVFFLVLVLVLVSLESLFYRSVGLPFSYL
jgi:hypothetical protein